MSVSLLSMLADKLNMTPEEAERWIVNLIRNARLDAKIDSKLVGRCFPNPKICAAPSFGFTRLDQQNRIVNAECVSPGSRGDGQQRRVAVPAGD